MGKKKLTKRDLIKKWKELDSKSEKPVGLRTVCNKMGIKPYHVTQLFRGENLTEIKLRHKIRISPPEKPYTKDELLEKYDRVVSKHKKIPTWNQIKYETGIPDSTFKNKFKKTNDLKRDIVTAYEKWLEKHKPKSVNLKIVKKWFKGKDELIVLPSAITKSKGKKTPIYQKTNGRTYGKPLAFRNMIYEPINEQGVVLLFGMVSEELGFSIEGVWVEFPDCEAKRIVNRITGQQQPVKIEFEYKSKEFEKHVHEVQNCDLIVCWKNNWKDCPVEVLDLSQAIKELHNANK